jgi:hypothetical protein
VVVIDVVWSSERPQGRGRRGEVAVKQRAEVDESLSKYDPSAAVEHEV